MHEGFKEFMEASLGSWHSESRVVIISRITESELNYLKSLYKELKNPLFYYKLEGKYTNKRRQGNKNILAVDSQLEGYVFTSGMRVTVPKKYIPYTEPLKMIYEASARRLEWWSFDGVVRDVCYLTSKNERTREIFLGQCHKLTHEKRIQMDNSYWEKDKVA